MTTIKPTTLSSGTPTKKLTRISKQVSALSAADVGALSATATAVNSNKLNGKSEAQVVSEARNGLVLNTITVNNKPLSNNVVLSAADVGAAPASHAHDYVPNTQKGKASGVATLDTNGKIPQNQLPAIAIKDTHMVKNQAEMLALVAQTGDMAVRTDLRQTYVLMREGSTVLANWQELLTPTDVVQSVNGQRGVVTLDAAAVGAEKAFAKNNAFNKSFGTAAGTVAQGNDARIVGAVQKTVTVNGHALASNIELTFGDVGALGATATAVNSTKFNGKTEAQVIEEARSGLALAGASYTKAESDDIFLLKSAFSGNVKDLIKSSDIVMPANSNKVALPEGITSVCVLSVQGALQGPSAFDVADGFITFGEEIIKDEVITILGLK